MQSAIVTIAADIRMRLVAIKIGSYSDVEALLGIASSGIVHRMSVKSGTHSRSVGFSETDPSQYPWR